MRDRPNPLPSTFLSKLQALEKAYLHSSDPAEQSGFYGRPERWRAEREPILEAISADGELLDTSCANGYLLECLVAWGRERGVSLIPVMARFSAPRGSESHLDRIEFSAVCLTGW